MTGKHWSASCTRDDCGTECESELCCVRSGIGIGVRPFTPFPGSRSIHHDQSMIEIGFKFKYGV